MLTKKKVALTKKEERSLLAQREVSPRDLACLIGKLSPDGMRVTAGRSYLGSSYLSMAESAVAPTNGGNANRLLHPSSM